HPSQDPSHPSGTPRARRVACLRRKHMTNPRHNTRTVRAATGTEITAKSWLTEAPLRMLMNNLDPDVAERPNELVVYGGIGRAARTWDDFDRIVATLRD